MDGPYSAGNPDLLTEGWYDLPEITIVLPTGTHVTFRFEVATVARVEFKEHHPGDPPYWTVTGIKPAIEPIELDKSVLEAND